ncbi:T6SS immunity protein Tli4 family protein [Acinetobacter gerneri]|uniref:T6SS immunity protein Tli4 family protein n=1 Tax=Acinetobacter gerneri TaxID=202952 RepID=A0AAW8JLA6_9GAMM|nr:T6SS immunity protein Tli4 family protein [Acinetobacter gerneri]MDQ9010927.1 T6SS immunity protein Tli4 family protein [Acinetobacter gerneri]MDQ9015063.1 T6SS immunity protein Tli4 family protein [Acinetobacter gerneri]MDQ9026230.1 T6SS immunity protein Tli4 family protein [Acinetobacter gerneri]MDQ9053511.1 T6SS immunity protein Tli4 family protein [Acinetobacter gerneri]MDQ9061130.1 T6SS immunity protein Tli4 family protein [Acinetobacter gerneri]
MKKLASVLVLATTIFNTSCSYAGISQSNQFGGNMNMINLQDTKTWCLGRYAFEIPAEANVFGQSVNFDTFRIKVKSNASKADYDQSVEKIRNDYKTEGKRILLDDKPEVKYGQRLTKIIRGKYSSDPLVPIDVFAFVLDKNTLFLIEGGYGNREANKLRSDETIEHIVKNLRARGDHEVPAEAGFCIDKGFIKDSGEKYRYSMQQFSFDFIKYPSVVIRFEEEATLQPTLELIPRITEKLLKVGQSKRQIEKGTIRKGIKNQISSIGLQGQEWITIEPMKGKDGISALWEHTGTSRQALDPLIKLEVNTGYESFTSKTASLTEIEALKLYELIMKSIRKF